VESSANGFPFACESSFFPPMTLPPDNAPLSSQGKREESGLLRGRREVGEDRRRGMRSIPNDAIIDKKFQRYVALNAGPVPISLSLSLSFSPPPPPLATRLPFASDTLEIVRASRASSPRRVKFRSRKKPRKENK
jgi:hypothetical protein